MDLIFDPLDFAVDVQLQPSHEPDVEPSAQLEAVLLQVIEVCECPKSYVDGSKRLPYRVLDLQDARRARLGRLVEDRYLVVVEVVEEGAEDEGQRPARRLLVGKYVVLDGGADLDG